MSDERRHASQLRSLLSAEPSDRRTLLRTVGAIGVAGALGTGARRIGTLAQGAVDGVIRSRTREAVMQEILAAYPDLERDDLAEALAFGAESG